MERVVEPELLDVLPATDPRAIRSRRDLRRVNAWMGNARILRRVLNDFLPHRNNLRLVELGAGDGNLLLNSLRGVTDRGGELLLIDQRNVISESTNAGFIELGWKPAVVTTDVFEWMARGEKFDCIVANLFLHHFSPEQLASLFEHAASQTHLFVACEPKRVRFARAAGRMLFLIGCNDVTRHDAEVSIRAGFRDREISQWWPKRPDWELRETSAGLFSHCFVAHKR